MREGAVELLQTANATQLSLMVMRLADPTAFRLGAAEFETKDDVAKPHVDPVRNGGKDPNNFVSVVKRLTGKEFTALKVLVDAQFLDMTAEAQAILLHYGVTYSDWALHIPKRRAGRLLTINPRASGNFSASRATSG